MKIGLKIAGVCGALFVLAAAGTDWGYAIPMPTKADDAIAGTEAWIKQHPQDAEAYYVLGRLHSMAWAYGDNLEIEGSDGELASFVPWDTVEVARKGTVKKGDARQLEKARRALEPGGSRDDDDGILKADKHGLTPQDAEHIAASIAAYQKAVQLDPKTPLYHLGLAWMLQKAGENARGMPAGMEKPTEAQSIKYAAAIKQLGDQDYKVREAATSELTAALPTDMEILKHAKADDPEVVARIDGILVTYWNLQALEHYRSAYTLSLDSDLKAQMFCNETPVSLQAGTQLLEILAAHPEAANKDEQTTVKDAIDKVAKIPRAEAL